MTAPSNPAPTMLADFEGYLTPEQSAPIFERATRMSAVQSLATQVPLSPDGKNVPVVTGRPAAGWVTEGSAKPITSGGMALKNMQPHKLAGIFIMSAEVVRRNPGNYANVMRDNMAQAFATAFDGAALHGTDTPFATWVDQTPHTEAVTSTGTWTSLNAGLSDLVNDTEQPYPEGRRLTGFAFDTTAEPILNGALDNAGRPIFVDTPPAEANVTIRPGRLMGRPSVIAEGVGTPEIIGYGGDWTQVVWGTVGGITFDVSTEATLPIGDAGAMVSLFQNNLVAVRAEAEYGFLVNDVRSFVRYENGAAGGA